MNAPAIDSAMFRKVLGHYPTGVCVITAMDEESRPLGMVVGSFTSVSLDPPLVGFLPDKNSNTWNQIEKVGHFCVNVLASGQRDTCSALASRSPDKFESVEYTLSMHGQPVIAGTVARIHCTLDKVVDAGDHWFVLGRVLSLDADMDTDADPMLFYKGRYGGFAEIA